MLIDDQVRIRSLLRALHEVIIPSIPSDAALAVEQAHLVCRHLDLMLTLSDYNYRLQLAELAQFDGLLRALIECLPPSQDPSVASARELLSRAEPIARLAVPDCGTIGDLTRQLREAADQTLRQALETGGGAGRAAAQAVLDFAARQIRRERAAVKTAGFDIDAAIQADLQEVS